MSFEERLTFGKAGESVIALFLRARGNTVLPAYDKPGTDNKGPQIFQPKKELISPDFLVWRGRQVQWIEAKHKRAFTFHRMSGRWVTGIDLRHYADYCAVADGSPWPVWLMFLHLDGQAKDSPSGGPAGLFGNDLELLRKNENHRHSNWGNGGMVYWAHTSLLHIASVEQVMAASRDPVAA